jgi:tetratricopeptide (TPR) repeat protein
MKMVLNKIFLFLTFQCCFCIFVYGQDIVVKKPIYDSALLQPGQFNAALAGLTEIDFLNVRNTLLTMQPDIAYYPKKQQSQYWYYLALSAWKMGLSSDNVIPNIEKALYFTESLEGYVLFQILMNAKDMARDYQRFAEAIKYIDQIKILVGKQPEGQPKIVTPIDAAYAIAHYEVGKNKKAIGYLNTLIFLTEVAGNKPIRYWFQVLSSAQEQTGDIQGAIKTLKKQIALYPHQNSVEYLEVLQSSLTNTSV